MRLMLLATRSAYITDVYPKKEKHHEKQSYQDSSIDGNVARNGLGFGPGRYIAGTSLLSPSVRREITSAPSAWTRSSPFVNRDTLGGTR